MSDSPNWMPFYVDDYLGDTGDLSTIEHGAYVLLILHYWKHRGLPTDDKRLARIARVSDAEWQSMRDALFMHFKSEWKHNRIERELAKADETIAKRKAAGVAGASARYGKGSSKRMPEPVATASQTDTPLPSPTQEDSSLRSLSSARVAEKPDIGIPITLWRGERTPEWFDRIEAESRDAAGLNDDPSPALLDTSPIVTLIDQGYDFARDILPKLRAAKAANKRGRSWAYYVPQITEGKAKNAAIPSKSAPSAVTTVWIEETDPRWPLASDAWERAKGKPPPRIGSKTGTERGWHFPVEFVPQIAA